MSPAQDYHDRLARFGTEEVALQGRLAWTGNLRFAFFLWGILQLWLTIYLGWLWLPGLLLPFGLFIFFSLAFEKARRLRHVQRGLAWYSHGLARLEDRWTGLGVTGVEFLNENHPYSSDLDVFGPSSLYQRLCDAHTRVGRETLARWLQGPPEDIDALRSRQEAVRDLAPRLEWRERLTLHGSGLPNGIDTARLDVWGHAVTRAPAPLLTWIALALVAVTLSTALAWGAGWLTIRPFLVAITVQVLFALALRSRVHHALDGLAGRSRDLLPLASILRLIESEAFTSDLGRSLQSRLMIDDLAGREQKSSPSQRLDDLAGYIEKLDARQNTFFALLAPFFLWTTRVAFQVERWRFQTGPRLAHWIPVIGEFEALASLAGYAFENPDDAWPTYSSEGPSLHGKQLGHPLLPRDACVRNDIELSPGRRLLLVSGSNMSGKSTYLRTIGLNTVLAQAGAPIRGESLVLSPVSIGATLRIQDSLMKGQSRFYAEIRRLRQVVELSNHALPLLFLLDEILHGTNSHDRRIGTEGIIHSLLDRRTIGLVTTHDLALTEIAERLAPIAENVHFADQLVDGKMQFDYRLHEGVVRHSNALALMKAVGLEIGGVGL